MNQNTNKLRLVDQNTFKEEIEQYDSVIKYKESKYNSLADMKRKIYFEISLYSDEELDHLRAYIMSKATRADKVLSGFLPVWAAIAIALCNVIWDSQILAIASAICLICFLVAAGNFNNDGIKRLNFCTMVLELIEKAEQVRGHTFNDSLAEEYNRSLAISEADQEMATDEHTEET